MPVQYSSKHNTRSVTQMMQMNWNVMVSSRNRKHVSRSMMIRVKNIITKERTRINRVAQRDVTNVNRSGEWFNMESRNLVPGGSREADAWWFDPCLLCWTLGHVPDDWLGLCWLHDEVAAFDSHVKRALTREFVFPIHWVQAQQCLQWPEALENS